MKKNPLLGNITPTEFLRDYWHKKPLLIRAAIPQFKAPIGPDELFALAANNEVESRLITHFKQDWVLKNGPFTTFPDKLKKAWTLLVQGVNLHNHAANEIMQRFRFLPDARLDDLMISYASEGGGVGPHFDSYDVFLLQAHGRRHWKISAQKDFSLIEGMPLKILSNFTSEQEFTLEPGDMLYLPPHYAHDGIALDECMTYSIGFRAPAFQEFGESFLQFMSDSIDLPDRYGDADLKPSRRPAELSKELLTKVAEEIRKVQFTDEDITIFIGEYLSTPKFSVVFDTPEKPLTPTRFLNAAIQRGIRLALKSRILYRGKHLFVNGESFSVSGGDKKLLNSLADTHVLDGASVAAASTDMQETLCMWYEDGWITLNTKK